MEPTRVNFAGEVHAWAGVPGYASPAETEVRLRSRFTMTPASTPASRSTKNDLVRATTLRIAETRQTLHYLRPTRSACNNLFILIYILFSISKFSFFIHN